MASFKIERVRIKESAHGQNSASSTEKLRKITNYKLFTGQTIGKEKEQKR